MTDTEKVNMIQDVLAGAWEYVTDANDAGYWRGVLIAIEVIARENGERRCRN
jgi:hypothetical protein